VSEDRATLAFAGRISLMESVIDRLSARIRGGFAMKIASGESSVSLLEARINAADPRRILERGYALALDSRGVVMKSAGGSCAGDRVSLMFADGTLDCVVEDCRA
jgi:exodeoxyribonuclease VII large subunit